MNPQVDTNSPIFNLILFFQHFYADDFLPLLLSLATASVVVFGALYVWRIFKKSANATT